MGHNLTVSNCGLLVNPVFPWLGASPDRIAYDPEESSYGVEEIKCLHSLRNKKVEQLRPPVLKMIPSSSRDNATSTKMQVEVKGEDIELDQVTKSLGWHIAGEHPPSHVRPKHHRPTTEVQRSHPTRAS
ncbi:hypothetical protein HPB48_000505 [Haemaphysalis longicornis]|uniref:YqaJ viral recombinase domain-containing protein n=1 Tax=Haemaphysalis longicornis TaxID=44386 RepID=A0A9J6GD99_HAELO|nr:hypothetical protein HPB48_000505 [Haemaphysalis longicornis]